MALRMSQQGISEVCRCSIMTIRRAEGYPHHCVSDWIIENLRRAIRGRRRLRAALLSSGYAYPWPEDLRPGERSA